MNHHAAYQGQIRLTMKKQFICFYPCDLTNLWQLEQWFSKCEPQISITWELVRNANCGHHPAKIPQKWRCAFLSASYRRYMISICNITRDAVCLGDSPPRTVCTACEQNWQAFVLDYIFKDVGKYSQNYCLPLDQSTSMLTAVVFNKGHFWFSQLGWRREEHPTMHRIFLSTWITRPKMLIVARLRNPDIQPWPKKCFPPEQMQACFLPIIKDVDALISGFFS